MPTDSLLRLEDATVRFGGRAALDSVGLGVAEHEIVCVLGPSGSGKSTLLRAVAGLQPLDAGRVLLDGRDQAGVPAHRRGVGLMFQDHQLFPQRDVGGNVAFGLRMHGASRAEQVRRVKELLELVGLPGASGRAVAARPGLADRIDHISTGGGASLELLEQGDLPGLEALRKGRG